MKITYHLSFYYQLKQFTKHLHFLSFPLGYTLTTSDIDLTSPMLSKLL